MLHRVLVFRASSAPTLSPPRADGEVRAVASDELCRAVSSISPSAVDAARTGSQAWAVLGQDRTYRSWGFLATPASMPPRHLSNSTRGRYWIWHCRTAKEWQGRGYYTALLVGIAQGAQAEDPGAEVFVDVAPDNVAARRAVAHAGFERDGTAFYLKIPKGRRYLSIWLRHWCRP